MEDDEEPTGFEWDLVGSTQFGGKQATELMLVIRGAIKRVEIEQNNGQLGESRRRKQ